MLTSYVTDKLSQYLSAKKLNNSLSPISGLFTWFVSMVCLLMVTSGVTIGVTSPVTVRVTSPVTVTSGVTVTSNVTNHASEHSPMFLHLTVPA